MSVCFKVQSISQKERGTTQEKVIRVDKEMALEAVAYPQDRFGYACKDLCSLGAGASGFLDQNTGLHANWDSSSPSMMQHAMDWAPNSSPEDFTVDQSPSEGLLPATTAGRRKRRRTKNSKNKEEIENQRMTHIAVERNRRKQMNEYLAVLRSLMPSSYVERGDQASIIGGSINFVKVLEQLLQSMESQKRTAKKPGDNGVSSPFADFFNFPQYASLASQHGSSFDTASDSSMTDNIADIEVKLVRSHANIKILTKRQPRQLQQMVARFQRLRLSILHLNITTTIDQMVLYSLSVKIEEGCHLSMSTVDEIAGAVKKTLVN
ncbi:transcription factor bHLH94-like [Mangifera indica]|uniref:transcription factor bHLH94-like n=1 Tax=Mangifera indica TaxID=29780 RepID=UPI001CF959FB|nr:transcription factor bHLH94-like [Mangifera indica]